MAVGNLVTIWAIGPILWLSTMTLCVFFLFIYDSKSGHVKVIGLVLSVMNFVFGITPQPFIWAYDNTTITWVYQYMVPPGGNALDLKAGWYYALFIFECFLILWACVDLMLWNLEYQAYRKKRDEFGESLEE